MRPYKHMKFLAIVFSLLFLYACSPSGAVEVGDTAPDFTLKDMDGKTVSLSDFKGKVVILDFFATWCPPCRSEIPDFVALMSVYEPDGFSVIGVSSENGDEVKGFAKYAGINYPVLIDVSGQAHSIYGPIRAIPTTFVIGKDSKIARVYIGARTKDIFEKDVKELLKAK